MNAHLKTLTKHAAGIECPHCDADVIAQRGHRTFVCVACDYRWDRLAALTALAWARKQEYLP